MEIETLKEQAATLGYRLSKIPEKKATDPDAPKRARQAVYLKAAPVLELRDEVDKDDAEYLTSSVGDIKVLFKLFMDDQE